jgi:hypothetical protein
MKKKNSTKKKTIKKPSKKKKKKLLKNTENAIHKKMAPTKKKNKYIESSEGNNKTVPKTLSGSVSNIDAGDSYSSASDLTDDIANGSDMADNDLSDLNSEKKEN